MIENSQSEGLVSYIGHLQMVGGILHFSREAVGAPNSLNRHWFNLYTSLVSNLSNYS